jgi:hypothetical protein
MRDWLISEYRRIGPRKIVIVSIAIVIMVVLAYGNNIGNSSARVLVRAASVSAAAAPPAAPRPAAGS